MEPAKREAPRRVHFSVLDLRSPKKRVDWNVSITIPAMVTAEETGIARKDINAFLHRQDVYTKHKAVNWYFRKQMVYITHPPWRPVAGIDMQKFKCHNDNMNYILSVVDIFMKYSWAVPIMQKTRVDITKAFRWIFRERKLGKVHTDKETYQFLFSYVYILLQNKRYI